MKKVLTFGVYDYFHLGHLRLFKQCREHGDYLIVAVQDSEDTKRYKPNTKVLYSTEERMEMLSALRFVDEVMVYHDVCVATLENIDFDVLALGEDHTAPRFVEVSDWCIKHGKEVVRLKRTQGICSTDIKELLKK